MFESQSNKGKANGYVPLNDDIKIDGAYLPQTSDSGNAVPLTGTTSGTTISGDIQTNSGIIFDSTNNGSGKVKLRAGSLNSNYDLILPNASGAVNMVFKVNNIPADGNGNIVLDIPTGTTITSTGASTDNIFIPTPIVTVQENGVYLHFNPFSSREFYNRNPEIFLMRFKKKKKSNQRLSSGWKFSHPSTLSAHTKWSGWKFFNGGAHGNVLSGETFENIVTEWPMPVVQDFNRFQIPINKFMYWVKRYVNPNTSAVALDHNITSFGNIPANDFYTSNIYRISNKKASITNPKTVNQLFAFVVAIDNPEATKTNEKCPKIFGPMSNIFKTVPENKLIIPGDDLPYYGVDIRITTIIRSKTIKKYYSGVRPPRT